MEVKLIKKLTQSRYYELQRQLIAHDGTWRVLPKHHYDAITEDELSFICNKHAFYGVVTEELIDWLRQHILGSAIEIGSGTTGLGRALGIPMIDSDVQNLPGVQFSYRLLGQPTITLPDDVIRAEALTAVEQYQPDTVIGMWVTQLWKSHMGEDCDAFVYGIDEMELLKRVRRYIVIGNDKIHGRKEIMQIPHETYRCDWLLSRSQHQELNAIYVWDCD